jgi:type VI secretion system secreted protein Hcp
MAATDYLLKLDGIKGEVQDPDHEGEIKLDYWSFAASNDCSPPGISGMGAGRCSLTGITCRANQNQASPQIALACATGRPIDTAVITCRKSGGEQEEYLVITLTSVRISSYKVTVPKDAILPEDEFCLNFYGLCIQYKTQDDNGNLVAAGDAEWNLQTVS